MIKFFFMFLVFLLLGALIIDIKTVFFIFSIYFFGLVTAALVNINDKRNFKKILNIYQLIFIVGFIYTCMCYMYMTEHGYSYLLAIDIDSYFVPVTRESLDYGNLNTAIANNWEGYNFFDRYHTGYFGFVIPFAYLSNYLGANFYVSMQFTTLLVASLNGIVIYKLFLLNNFNSKKAYKYTIIICLFSVLFFYSTQMLRDAHIMFLYLLGVYLTFKAEFSITQLLKLLIVIGLSCTLRIETGLFQFFLVPVYLLLSMQQSRKKTIAVLTSFTAALAGIVLSVIYSSQIISLLSANSEAYLETDKGSGVVGTLQGIPVVGHILSIFYNAAQPLPFWAKYTPPFVGYRPEVYNIMTFPLSFAALFNWIVLFFIGIFLINAKLRRRVKRDISKPLAYHLFIGFVFLYIQATVISQRRLMAYYVVFYILFYIIYTNLYREEKKLFMFAALTSYSIMQLASLVYKI